MSMNVDEDSMASLESEMKSMLINNEKKLVMLTSSDGKEFVIKDSLAVQSETIKNILEDCELRSIPIQNVDGKTLGKIIEYWDKHSSTRKDEDLEKFDDEFLDVDQSTLFDLIMAANYLAIQDLLAKICKKVASMIKGKSVEAIRETFRIENDFEPYQEAEIRAENSWAFV